MQSTNTIEILLREISRKYSSTVPISNVVKILYKSFFYLKFLANTVKNKLKMISGSKRWRENEKIQRFEFSVIKYAEKMDFLITF